MFCLVALLLGGAGSIVAFVYGILKSRDWEVAPTMMLWGTCLALHLLRLGHAAGERAGHFERVERRNTGPRLLLLDA